MYVFFNLIVISLDLKIFISFLSLEFITVLSELECNLPLLMDLFTEMTSMGYCQFHHT